MNTTVLVVGAVFAMMSVIFLGIFLRRYRKEQQPEPMVVERKIIEDIVIDSTYVLWDELGRPENMGDRIQARMENGKMAVYELYRIEPITTKVDVKDVNRYHFRFTHYRKLDEDCYPKYC